MKHKLRIRSHGERTSAPARDTLRHFTPGSPGFEEAKQRALRDLQAPMEMDMNTRDLVTEALEADSTRWWSTVELANHVGRTRGPVSGVLNALQRQGIVRSRPMESTPDRPGQIEYSLLVETDGDEFEIEAGEEAQEAEAQPSAPDEAPTGTDEPEEVIATSSPPTSGRAEAQSSSALAGIEIVQAWKTSDGVLYETELEAAQHEAWHHLVKLLSVSNSQLRPESAAELLVDHADDVVGYLDLVRRAA